MQPEDKFVLDFLPILREYLHTRLVDNMDRHLDVLEEQVRLLTEPSPVVRESASESESESASEKSEEIFSRGDGLYFRIKLDDLKEHMQQFILSSLKFSSKEELEAAYPGHLATIHFPPIK